MCFVFGSVSWELTPEQKVLITDTLVCEKRTIGDFLRQDVDLSAFPLKLRQTVDAERAETFPCYDLYFSVHIAFDDS